MPDWKKLKLKITGKIRDEDMTPLTLPMARLAEYLTDLADILGQKDDVHLVGIEDGSAQGQVWMHPNVFPAAMNQMRSAQLGTGARDATLGYRRFNDRLREDQGSADLIDEQINASIFEFPGIKEQKVVPIRGIREHASIAGELRRIGGLDKSIHLLLRRADGEIIKNVECDEGLAKQMEGLLFNYIRVHGIATWIRDENGVWKCDKFRAQSFDPDPLVNEPFAATMQRLKSLPGNKWGEFDDPYGELRNIREGNDEKPQ